MTGSRRVELPLEIQATVAPEVRALLREGDYRPVPDYDPRAGLMDRRLGLGVFDRIELDAVTEFFEKLEDWLDRNPVERIKRDDVALAVIDYLGGAWSRNTGKVPITLIRNNLSTEGLDLEGRDLSDILKDLTKAGLIDKGEALDVSVYGISRRGRELARKLDPNQHQHAR